MSDVIQPGSEIDQIPESESTIPESDSELISESIQEVQSIDIDANSPYYEILMSTEETDPIVDGDGSFLLAPYMQRSYLEYAMSVVKGRSLPDVADGQKPVQRRILYTMSKMGLTSTSKHIKSARVVGDVMGKLHPHGDGSIYDAMVLYAQDFSRRYPLVDGQGNFGSRDGDGAAAMRYTEARLTQYAELLLSEIDSGTVDFVPNYDGAFTEPDVLPARMPFGLLNGSKGAAVGYATEIPSHNMREVAGALCLLIKNPDASLSEVMEHIIAPDFPGGGQLICPKHIIHEAYASGRGSLRMRARWKREDQARGQWRIIVSELPHTVSTANILAEIEAATNPQPPVGKKDLTQKQKNIKALMLSLIDAARDESDKAQPVRLVIEPKTSKISEEELMAALLVHTSLESSVPVNLVMIGNDGNPNQKTLISILKEWIDFRYETVERRTRHRLEKVESRIHILDGRLQAFMRIEEVIRIIRESDDPKIALMAQIGLSEIQSEDILEIRLRQLARLEGIRIEKEAAELREEAKQLRQLLDNRHLMTNLILGEIEADSKKYSDDRRTLVEPVESIRSVEVSVPDEPITILISKNGWLRARQGHGIDKASITWKQSDSERAVIEMRTTHSVYLVDDNGRAYSIKASTLPTGRGDGVPMNTLLEVQAGAKIVHIIGGDPAHSYLFSNSSSYGFITQLKELDSRGKAGKAFMTIEPGETILAPIHVVDMNDWLTACSYGPKEARMVMFPVNEMKIIPKGRGVIIMGLVDNEKLVSLDLLKGNPPTKVSVITDSGAKVNIGGEELKKFLLHRARKGCQLSKTAKPARVVTQ